MVHYENCIDIHSPKESVFNFITIPSNWIAFMPTTINVRPTINRYLDIGESVTEVLNILGAKRDITWTCTASEFFSYYEIEGISQHRGGSKTRLSFEFTYNNGVTVVRRVIQNRFDKWIMRLFDPLWKLYFIYEAIESSKRAKRILERNTK